MVKYPPLLKQSPACGYTKETTSHLFLLCSFSKEVLSLIQQVVPCVIPAGDFDTTWWQRLKCSNAFCKDRVIQIIFLFWMVLEIHEFEGYTMSASSPNSYSSPCYFHSNGICVNLGKKLYPLPRIIMAIIDGFHPLMRLSSSMSMVLA